MIPPLSSLTPREAVWLFPVAIAIHFSEEAPRFAKWARMHISPLYTDAHWRKIHGIGLAAIGAVVHVFDLALTTFFLPRRTVPNESQSATE